MVEVTSKHIGGLVVFIALIVALIAFISKQPGGYIETTGGSTCAWRLEGDATSDRAISFECKCNSGAVKYNCKYSGNPDITCPPFWRDVFGFFNQVRQTVADQKHACALSMIDHSDVEVCKDSKEFVLKRVGKATPSECQ